jgi:hypothetical protein
MKNRICKSSVAALAITLFFAACQKQPNSQKNALAAQSIFASEEHKITPQCLSNKTLHNQLEGKHTAHNRLSGWYTEAAFIYWQAEEDGLDYAIREALTGSQNFVEKIKDLNFEWSPGFQVGGGYRFSYDNWDFRLLWTWLYSDAESSISQDIKFGEPMFSSWESASLGQLVTHAKAKWNLHYNTLDFEIGKNYFISRKIALRPHIGLRGAIIDQDYRASYQGAFRTQASPIQLPQNFSIVPTQMKASNDFMGLGTRLGAGSQWHFNKHWNLTASIAAALLYGHFDVDQKYNGKTIQAVTKATAHLLDAVTQSDRDFNRIRANLEAAIGLQWETCFNEGRQRLAIETGYQLNEWFRQNELMRTDSAIAVPPLGSNVVNNVRVVNRHEHGDLQLQGVYFKLRADY